MWYIHVDSGIQLVLEKKYLELVPDMKERESHSRQKEQPVQGQECMTICSGDAYRKEWMEVKL